MAEIKCSEDWNDELGWKVINYDDRETPVFTIMDRAGKRIKIYTETDQDYEKMKEAYCTGKRIGLFFQKADKHCMFPYCAGCKHIRGDGFGYCCGNKESEEFGCRCYNGVVLDGFMATW